MSKREDRVERLLQRLNTEWVALQSSYAQLSEAQLTEPGVMGDWSVKDVLAHITTWEDEALKHLPTVLVGERPPRYVTYGGIDAFNAQMADQKRSLLLAEVARQRDDTHRRLIEFIGSVSEAELRPESRFVRRLRLDTYGHYALHAKAINEWRQQLDAQEKIAEGLNPQL